jgi:hypothetical protein
MITPVYVCFENGAGFETEMGWVADAIKRTWEATTFLRFDGFAGCNSPGGIHIQIDDSNPRTEGNLGTGIDKMHLNFTFNNFSPSCMTTREFCIRSIAIHEFGHALGIAHEANRPDSQCDKEQGNDGDTYFAYDPDSVMNYCSPYRTTLSPGDTDGIKRLYGSPGYGTATGRPYALRNDTGSYLLYRAPNNRESVTTGLTSMILSGYTDGYTELVFGPHPTVQYGDAIGLVQPGTPYYLGISFTPDPRGDPRYGSVGLGATTQPAYWTVGRAGNYDTDDSADVRDPITLSAVANGTLYYLAVTNTFDERGAPFPTLSFTTSPSSLGAHWRFMGPMDKSPGPFPDPFASIPMQNGWTDAAYGTASAALTTVAGIVQLQGGLTTTGTNWYPFTLPVGSRPEALTYVPVSLCNAHKGRLIIKPDGSVSVQADTSGYSNAYCFTSLEGVSFATSAAGFTPLTLDNGWTNAPYGTASAGVRNDFNTIRFRGAIATSGTNPVAFTLPVGFRPPTDTYVPIDLCAATKGRLLIQPSGVVTVQAEGNVFSNAQCFTSLDGASFALSDSGFTPLSLENGWTHAPYSTRGAAVKNENGIVRLEGAIAQGTDARLFTLPVGFRPTATVYVNVDLCNAAQGRLEIRPTGQVFVWGKNGLSEAQCFTSLEGVSFAFGK